MDDIGIDRGRPVEAIIDAAPVRQRRRLPDGVCSESTPVTARPIIPQLMAAEHASRTETTLRFAFVTLTGLALSLYTASEWGLLWAGGYLSLQTLHYLFLATRNSEAERAWEVGLAYVGYAATNLVFVSMPVGLILADDPILIAAAVFGIGALVVLLLWRPAPPRSLLPIDIAVHLVIVGVVLNHCLGMTENPLAQAVLVLSATAEACYFSMALYATTSVRHRLSAAALRGTEAQKMEALGRLTGGVAHDFNNMLTVLRGNLELHDEVTDPEERRMLIAEARCAAVRASGLAAQLSGFSRRSERGRDAPDAQAVIAEIAAMAGRVLPPGISVEATSPPGRMPLTADGDRLNASLLNLVLNARDAICEAGTGTGRIVIAAEPVDAGIDPEVPVTLATGSYIRFSVTDDGPGLNSAQAARALEPFYTTKPPGKGSGLGLPLARSFAEDSGGALDLRSKPGETRVSLYLPRGAGWQGPV